MLSLSSDLLTSWEGLQLWILPLPSSHSRYLFLYLPLLLSISHSSSSPAAVSLTSEKRLLQTRHFSSRMSIRRVTCETDDNGCPLHEEFSIARLPARSLIDQINDRIFHIHLAQHPCTRTIFLEKKGRERKRKKDSCRYIHCTTRDIHTGRIL